MPHLDEGALWVRATMPYTISFDEAAKITPQIRDVLRSFPEVTTVASELGRPDDGTDSTGFFNVEFYVGLKPYSDWTRLLSHQAGAYRGDQPEASEFPRHHLQLHPAGRGCGGRGGNRPQKRAGGQDVRHRSRHAGAEGPADQKILEHVQGITDVTLVQELGQPSLSIKIDRAKIARYGMNVDDVNNLIRPRSAAPPPPRWCRAKSNSTWWCGWIANTATIRKRSAISPWRLPAASRFRSRSWRIFRSPMARPSSIAKPIPAISAFSSRSKAAILPARWATPSARSTGR